MFFQAEEEAEEEEEEEEEDIEAVLAEEFEVREPLLLYKHLLIRSENDKNKDRILFCFPFIATLKSLPTIKCQVKLSKTFSLQKWEL